MGQEFPHVDQPKLDGASKYRDLEGRMDTKMKAGNPEKVDPNEYLLMAIEQHRQNEAIAQARLRELSQLESLPAEQRDVKAKELAQKWGGGLPETYEDLRREIDARWNDEAERIGTDLNLYESIRIGVDYSANYFDLKAELKKQGFNVEGLGDDQIDLETAMKEQRDVLKQLTQERAAIATIMVYARKYFVEKEQSALSPLERALTLYFKDLCGEDPPQNITDGKWISRVQQGRARLDMEIMATVGNSSPVIGTIEFLYRRFAGTDPGMPGRSEIVEQMREELGRMNNVKGDAKTAVDQLAVFLRTAERAEGSSAYAAIKNLPRSTPSSMELTGRLLESSLQQLAADTKPRPEARKLVYGRAKQFIKDGVHIQSHALSDFGGWEYIRFGLPTDAPTDAAKRLETPDSQLVRDSRGAARIAGHEALQLLSNVGEAAEPTVEERVGRTVNNYVVRPMFRVVKTLDDLISRDPSIKGELGPTAADVLEGFDRKQLDRTKKTITVMDALINSPEMSPEKLKEQRQELEQRDPGAMQRLMQEGQALANGSEDLSLEHPLVQSALRGGDIETKLKVWCWVTIRADKDFDQAFVENTNKVLGGEQAAGETIKQRGQEVKEVETKNRENLRGIIDVLKNKWFQITAVVVGVLALGFYGGWKTRKWFGRLGGDHGRRTTADLADDLRRSQRGPDGGDGDGGRRGTPPETPKDGGGDRGGGPPKKAPPEGKGGGDAASRPGPDTGRTRTVIVPTPGVPTTVQVPDTTSPPLKEPPKGSEATTRRPRGTPAAPAATSAASTNPGSGQRMNRRQALGKMMDPAAKIRERDQARGAATGSGERSISPYERAGRAYSDPAGRAALDRARATAPGTPPGEAKRANERVEAEHRQAGAGAPVDQRGKPKISQPPHVPRGAKGG